MSSLSWSENREKCQGISESVIKERIKTKIMKNMKMKGKTATGAEWEESVNAILQEMV
jgi:hypothetical protein